MSELWILQSDGAMSNHHWRSENQRNQVELEWYTISTMYSQSPSLISTTYESQARLNWPSRLPKRVLRRRDLQIASVIHGAASQHIQAITNSSRPVLMESACCRLGDVMNHPGVFPVMKQIWRLVGPFSYLRLSLFPSLFKRDFQVLPQLRYICFSSTP